MMTWRDRSNFTAWSDVGNWGLVKFICPLFLQPNKCSLSRLLALVSGPLFFFGFYRKIKQELKKNKGLEGEKPITFWKRVSLPFVESMRNFNNWSRTKTRWNYDFLSNNSHITRYICSIHWRHIKISLFSCDVNGSIVINRLWYGWWDKK